MLHKKTKKKVLMMTYLAKVCKSLEALLLYEITQVLRDSNTEADAPPRLVYVIYEKGLAKILIKTLSNLYGSGLLE